MRGLGNGMWMQMWAGLCCFLWRVVGMAVAGALSSTSHYCYQSALHCASVTLCLSVPRGKELVPSGSADLSILLWRAL
ncbi:hypothetical protein M758_UG117400 [Ceratodon purpureus]|nr:hypothetical protein M758_UG117400 [Ceratodon purpureus]